MSPHIRSAIRRARRVWGEMDYAQGRLFDFQTGVVATRQRRAPVRSDVGELEAMFAREDQP